MSFVAQITADITILIRTSKRQLILQIAQQKNASSI